MKRKEIYKEVIKEVNEIYECNIVDKDRDLINIVALNTYAEVCYMLIGASLASSKFYTEIGECVGRDRTSVYAAKRRVDDMCFINKEARKNIDVVYNKVKYYILSKDESKRKELIEWHKSELNKLINN